MLLRRLSLGFCGLVVSPSFAMPESAGGCTHADSDYSANGLDMSQSGMPPIIRKPLVGETILTWSSYLHTA
jgi:hypothetical protein